VFARQNILIN